MTTPEPQPQPQQPDPNHPSWQTYSGPVPITWAAFTVEILSLYEPPLRAISTYKKIRQMLGMVADLGVTSTAELTPPLVAKFIASRPKEASPNTTYGEVASLRSICNYAASQGYCRQSPFAVRKHWVRRCEPKARKHHSREEIARVLTLMKADIGRKWSWARWRSRRLYALASVVAYTGLRKNEALYLRVEDIALTDRMLLICPRVGNRLKTEKSAQPVPIPDALVPILAEWLSHLELPAEPQPAFGPLPASNPDGIRDPGWVFPNAGRTGPWIGGPPGHRPIDRMKRLGQRAGVEGFTFLSLRHSWATHAEFWGMSDAMIQRVLRHTNTQTQFHYRHADGDNLRAKTGGIGFGHDLAEAEMNAVGAKFPSPPPLVTEGQEKPAIDRGPKLDDDDAAEMRRLRAAGWTYKALIKRFEVAKSTVHAVLAGETHRHVPPAES